MGSMGTLTVWLTANTSKFDKGMAQAQRTIMGWKSAIAGGLAAVGAGAFLKDSVKAFMDSENASNDLAAAIERLGGASAYVVPMLSQYAADIQRVTKYEDDAVVSAMAFGTNLGIKTGQIKDATRAAIGLAAQYKLDLNGAMMLVGRAANGNTQMLKRYGIVLGDNLTPQQKFAELLKIGAGGFELATKQAETTEGRLVQLQNAWGDLKEVVGEFVVSVLDLPELFGQGTNALQAFTDMLKSNLPGAVYFVKAMALEFQSAFQKIWLFTSGFGSNLGIVFAWIGKNWSILWDNAFKLFSAYIKDAIATLTEAFKLMFKNSTLGITAIWDYIKSGGKTDIFGQIFEGMTSNIAGYVGSLGSNLDKALSKSGTTKLKLFDFADLSEGLARIDEETAKRRESLFWREQEKVGTLSGGTGQKKAIEQAVQQAVQQAPKMKVETSVVSAVQKGSAEALKLENQRMTEDKRIENNTRKTAKNTDLMVKHLERIAGGAGLETADAFGGG